MTGHCMARRWMRQLMTSWILIGLCYSQLMDETDSRKVQLKLVIGVFSPGDSGWEEAIDHRWSHLSENETSAVDEPQFIFYRESYEGLSLSHVREVRALLQAASVSVVIGPYNPVLELVTDDEKIPYITTTTPPDMLDAARMVSSLYTFHLLPEERLVYRAVIDLFDKYQWEEAAVLYSDGMGHGLIAEMMTRPQFKLRAWRLLEGEGSDELRDHLLKARHLGMRHYIVVCNPAVLDSVMQIALRLSMLSDRYAWLVVNLDPSSIDYQPYLFTNVNFTTFQLFHDMPPPEPPEPSTRAVLGMAQHNLPWQVPDGIPPLQYAVSADALSLVLNATLQLAKNESAIICPPYCSHIHTVHGDTLTTYLNEISILGQTGRIHYDGHMYRRDIFLQVMFLNQSGLVNIGYWAHFPGAKTEIKVKPYEKRDDWKTPNPLGKGVVQIVTIVDPPFVMRNEDFDTQVGNARYQGYLIDLITEIAHRLDFRYELYESPDGNYGSSNSKGQWNGMIQELIIGNASMCLGAISITSERESVVDFTKPYKQKMFNFLMKRPEKKTSIFQFLWPLSTQVWLLTISSMVVVGGVLFVMDKVSSNSRQGRAGRFDLSESIWFAYGSLVGAGTEIVPRTVSGRLLTGAWWFFGLILVSSYTANLAAFLTVVKIETPIKSVVDLAAQNKIQYGTVKNTYANSMFRHSTLDTFSKMWQYMDTFDTLVDNFSVGLDKVKQGDYAFIWDSPINKYIAMFECDTMAVGEPFDEKGYGIGVPMGAPYRDDVTMMILSLSEEGFMQKLDEKWWRGGECPEFKEITTAGTKELNLTNVAGVFVVVAMGALLALVACVFEFIWLRSRKQKKAPPHDVMEREGSNVALKSSIYVNSANNSFTRKESRM